MLAFYVRTKNVNAPPVRGFTLTELAIVLGIVGIILGAIWTAAAGVYRQNKVALLTQEILTISQGIRSTYAVRHTMSAGCYNSAFVNAGIVPASMVGTGNDAACGQTTINDPWGLTVDIGSQQGWDGIPTSTSAFEILVGWPANTMSTVECISVLKSVVSNAATGAGLIGVGGQGITATNNIAALNLDTVFNTCSGHFTLQFSVY